MELAQWISDKSRDSLATVLLSGGRDSLLAAALTLEMGCNVIPLICDNGHMEGVERARYAVHHLKSVYGESRVCDLVCRKTGMAFLEFMQSAWVSNAKSLSQEYPDLLMYQAHCLACKTAMYVQALRFCREYSIHVIVDGVRQCQGFFVDLKEMHERFTFLCNTNGVELLTPVYELESDLTRKRMLNDRGLPTKTLEPQCFLGCPMKAPLDGDERRSLMQFYDKELKKYAMSSLALAKK